VTDVVARLTTALADHYQIERELGQGGMATVYLAHDVRHHRRVAIKVLRPELAAVIGAERFLREIEIAAQLSHPHILPLYDSGQVDGLLYYVMPHIEGESLRRRLDREKQLPIPEAVRLAQQVASALDYAHRQGILHRDIKPDNVLVHEGEALVADFGIALAVSAAGGERLTETGLSLGTPFYMSPEQATGDRELDARSDMYSLGCVLYEMLAGEPPYTGNTAQAVVAKLLTEHPRDMRILRDTVPAVLERAVAKALARLPADRYASAAEFAEALGRASQGGPAVSGSVAVSAPPTRERVPWRRRLRRVVTAPMIPWAVAAVALAGFAWAWLRPQPARDVYRFAVSTPDSFAVRADHNGTSLALSPDGLRLVYTGRGPGGRRVLLLRELGQLESRVLPGTEGAEGPFFSPDGVWIAFFADSKLKKIALAGGPALAIADAQNPRGGTWGPDGTIVFTPTSSSPLVRVSASGGVVDTLTTLASDSGETSHRYPSFLPSGRALVFTVQFGGRYRVAAASLEGGVVRPLVDEATTARYVSTGHLLYGSEAGALIAVPFDARRLVVTGSPVSLLEGLLVKPNLGAAEFTVSPAGTLAYLGAGSARGALTLVDRRGVGRVLTELVAVSSPRFSPDGRRIALTSLEQRTIDVRVYDIERGTLSRLSFNGNASYPEWTPDGQRVAFSWQPIGRGDRDLFWTPADGSGEPAPLVRAPFPQWEITFGADVRTMAIRQVEPATNRDIYAVAMDSARTLRPYVRTPFDERAPTLAPDGRWLAYVSNESGREEVYVRAFPDPAGRWQVSAGGGAEPRWARNGREIYYRSGDSLISVTVRTEPGFAVGTREVLFVRPFSVNSSHGEYDVHPDNRRFVMISGGTVTAGLVVALNWLEELKRRAPAGNR